MAVLMSFVALAIDAMLPALGEIGRDLAVRDPNHVQFVVSGIFFGMGLGLMFFGPFSDSFGRKPAIYLGMVLFSGGCLLSIFSSSFDVMITGRILQGVGAASCRVVTLSMIRDRFSGTEMAKILSLIMIIFILVPALAPSVGQGILYFGHWRTIFWFILFVGVAASVWFYFGQEETLAEEKRLEFSFGTITNGVMETLKHRVSRGFTVASALVFGAFVGYLSSSQQILQEQYKLGEKFAVVFGVLALSVGCASFANSRWVEKYGMIFLCKKALLGLVSISLVFSSLGILYGGHPPLIATLICLTITFFCFGILFGNFNTLAIQPLGHIAGVANSVISSIQTLLSVAVGGFIAYMYNGTILPLALGFLGFGFLSLLITFNVSKKVEIKF